MSARRSTLEGDADRRVFDRLQWAGGMHAQDERALADYIRIGRRQMWSWKLVGQALGISASRASAIWRRDCERRGL